jgi:hypothetical protein
VVKECVHIDTGQYYAAKVINKRLMAGREHMVFAESNRTAAALSRLSMTDGVVDTRETEEPWAKVHIGPK